MSANKEEMAKLQEKSTDSALMGIQKADDPSHVSEIIKEKLLEAFEPTETIAPKDAFIPFLEAEENTGENNISYYETEQLYQDIEKQETEVFQQEIEEPQQEAETQNITTEEFEIVLRNEGEEVRVNAEGYIYINVMETFVKEVIIDYMKQYALCTCNHCIIDTMALALTHLPSKYIVVKKGDLSPLLHMYRSKYATLISTEVLKACLAVGKSPHHKQS